jgi:phosphohistidine phosphatase
MDLILWRHAEAEDTSADGDDLKRALTSRGERQAARMAAWLDQHLPENARILCSPALRCEQTAVALGRQYKIRNELGPDAAPDGLLEAAQWPSAKQPVLIVGHQPALGQVIGALLNIKGGGCAMRKGAVWWLRAREREGERESIVVSMQSPDLL